MRLNGGKVMNVVVLFVEESSQVKGVREDSWMGEWLKRCIFKVSLKQSALLMEEQHLVAQCNFYRQHFSL